jgi:AbrB family looped-hinge helix DNA binding protein
MITDNLKICLTELPIVRILDLEVFPSMVTAILGQRGVLTIPADIREALGLESGCSVLIEVREGAIVIRPAVTQPVEKYTLQRRAELLLNNAVVESDYQKVCETVRLMGFDPATIPHDRPRSGDRR